MSYFDACEYIGRLLNIPEDFVKLDIASLQFHNTLTAGHNYFLSSGISHKTLDKCGDILTLAETSESQYIAFLHPNHADSGMIDAAHLLFPKTSDDTKNTWAWFNKPRHLWGLYKAIVGDRSLLVITEGEKDALAVMEAGFNAVSVPSGASNMKWLDADIEFLKLFDDVCIMFDNDQAGLTASRRLMFEMVNLGVTPSVVNWHYAHGLKDAADVLKYSGSSQLEILINKRVQVSLDFSQLILDGKPDHAIIKIDDRQYTVKYLRLLLTEGDTNGF
jgi:5S rRNA maturation endonuclease (ribonuclease M5)